MSRYGLVRIVLGVAALFVAVPLAHAGTCSNAQINQAFAANRMTPNGSGNSGDCNPNYYGAGSWTSTADLQDRVWHSRDCADPWIGQIYWNLYHRKPAPIECNVANYSGGHWTTYMDLAAKVQTYQSATHMGAEEWLVDSSGNLLDNHGTVIAVAGSDLISNLVGPSGGTLTTPSPGMFIGHNGSALNAQRSLASVGGKRVIQGTIIKR